MPYIVLQTNRAEFDYTFVKIQKNQIKTSTALYDVLAVHYIKSESYTTEYFQ